MNEEILKVKLNDYVNKLNNAHIKFTINEFYDSIIIFLSLLSCFFITLYYLGFDNHRYHVITFTALAVFIFGNYPRIFISNWIHSVKINKIIRGISIDEKKKELWQNKFILNKEINLLDLIIARHYINLEQINYYSQKRLFVDRYSNCIQRNKFINESDILAKRSYFISIGQQDLDGDSLLIIYDLMSWLGVSTEEFQILKNNFLNNSATINKTTFEKIYSSGILTDIEYQQKQKQIKKMFKTKFYYLIKTSVLLYLLFVLGLVVSFFKYKLMH